MEGWDFFLRLKFDDFEFDCSYMLGSFLNKNRIFLEEMDNILLFVLVCSLFKVKD